MGSGSLLTVKTECKARGDGFGYERVRGWTGRCGGWDRDKARGKGKGKTGAKERAVGITGEGDACEK